MTTKDAARAFTIFLKYGKDETISVGHDIIYAGPAYDKLSREDLFELEELGWTYDRRFTAWTHYT